MIAIGDKMNAKHTSNFMNCLLCGQSNQFLIEVVEQKGDYYYMERCPRFRCNHIEEIRLINGREAKRYLDIPAKDPLV